MIEGTCSIGRWADPGSRIGGRGCRPARRPTSLRRSASNCRDEPDEGRADQNRALQLLGVLCGNEALLSYQDLIGALLPGFWLLMAGCFTEPATRLKGTKLDRRLLGSWDGTLSLQLPAKRITDLQVEIDRLGTFRREADRADSWQAFAICTLQKE